MTIAWYAHHHGAGHRQRALSVLAHVAQPAVVLSQASRPEILPAGVTWVRLPSDVHDAARGDVTAGGRLHWAPCHGGVMRRWAVELLVALDVHDVRLMVADVSVEATILARTAGVPVVSMRLHGDRTDAAHTLGYDLSVAAVAPYPEWFEQPQTPAELRTKTTYVGGLCRPQPSARAHDGPGTASAAQEAGRGIVVVLVGAGGTAADLAHLDRLAAASSWDWIGLGHARSGGAVDWRGFVADAAAVLARADVVVSAGGHNSVMECAALRRPLVCVPESRPFGEQAARARLLADLGLAVVVDSWSALRLSHLAAARRLGGARLATLVDRDAAPRVAQFVEQLAG